MPEKEAQKIAELLDAVSAKVPGIITAFRDAIFSEEAGRAFGQAVGSFYKELVASGIPSEQAISMAQQYIASLQSALNQVKGDFGGVRFGSRAPGEGCCGDGEPRRFGAGGPAGEASRAGEGDRADGGKE